MMGLDQWANRLLLFTTGILVVAVVAAWAWPDRSPSGGERVDIPFHVTFPISQAAYESDRLCASDTHLTISNEHGETIYALVLAVSGTVRAVDAQTWVCDIDDTAHPLVAERYLLAFSFPTGHVIRYVVDHDNLESGYHAPSIGVPPPPTPNDPPLPWATPLASPVATPAEDRDA